MSLSGSAANRRPAFFISLGQRFGSRLNLTVPIVFTLMSFRLSRGDQTDGFIGVVQATVISLDQTDSDPTRFSIVLSCVGPFQPIPVEANADGKVKWNSMLLFI
jgi:hypothetical protein